MGKQTKSSAYVLGVGLTKFIKPRGKVDYHELGFEAGIKALLDASINYDDVESGIACYCYGDSTCGRSSPPRRHMIAEKPYVSHVMSVPPTQASASSTNSA